MYGHTQTHTHEYWLNDMQTCISKVLSVPPWSFQDTLMHSKDHWLRILSCDHHDIHITYVNGVRRTKFQFSLLLCLLEYYVPLNIGTGQSILIMTVRDHIRTYSKEENEIKKKCVFTSILQWLCQEYHLVGIFSDIPISTYSPFCKFICVCSILFVYNVYIPTWTLFSARYGLTRFVLRILSCTKKTSLTIFPL